MQPKYIRLHFLLCFVGYILLNRKTYHSLYSFKNSISAAVLGKP